MYEYENFRRQVYEGGLTFVPVFPHCATQRYKMIEFTVDGVVGISQILQGVSSD